MAKAASFEEEEDSAPSPGPVPPLSEMKPTEPPVIEPVRKPAPAVLPLPKAAQPPRQQFSLRMTPGRSPLRKLFHLNDTFRFRRHLFAGSQEDFDASLCIVSEFTDFAQAEDYFYNDLQWDPEQPEVIDFMTIIRKYINER